MYFVPSLKTCPTSMPRLMTSGLPQCGQTSPSRTTTRSAKSASASFVSRARSTFFRWTSSLFAPTMQPLAPLSAWSAPMRRSADAGFTGPTLPAFAPLALRTVS